jgi:hypothetical protein
MITKEIVAPEADMTEYHSPEEEIGSMATLYQS